MSLQTDLFHGVKQSAVRKCAGPKSGYGAPGFFQALGRKLTGFLDMRACIRGVFLQALLGRIQLHHDSGETLRQRIMDIPRETRPLGDNGVALLLLGSSA